jgi:flavin-dependent dehydrogenase
MAVEPRTGVNTLVVGDAGGLINPFNGEGIAYGYETGRLAAAFLGEALAGGGSESIGAYERRLGEIYGDYYRVGRAFVRLISDPQRMRLCVATGMHSRPLMAQLMRIMANLMRPDMAGPAEAAFRGMVKLAGILDRLESTPVPA